jgi:hypothetical protein
MLALSMTCAVRAPVRSPPRKRLYGEVLGSPAPPASSADEAKNNEKKQSADGGDDDRSSDTRAKADAQTGQQPTSYQRANDANPDVRDKAEPEASYDEAGKPSGNKPDQQNDQ